MKTTKLRIINDNTGEWKVDFYENDRKCEAYEIYLTQCKVAKQYAAYGILRDDLKLLLKWAIDLKSKVDRFEKTQKIIKEKNFGIIKEKNDELQNELFLSYSAIVIIYGRLFSENKSRKLSLKRKEHVIKEDYLIHDELIKARKDYIAHSSDKMYEESKAFVILNPMDKSQFCIAYHCRKAYFPGGKLINEMIKHFENLSGKIKDKMVVLKDKLTEEYKRKKLIFKN